MSTTRKLLMATTESTGFGGQTAYGSPSFSGAVSFTVPAGVTSISVVIVDGGYGGGTGSNGSVSAPGSGGSGGVGGARRYLNNIAVTPGQVISGVVGGVGGTTSFGAFSGWIDAIPAASGEGGANGFTSDAGTNGGGRGGYGGGGASTIDAGSVLPNSPTPGWPGSPNGGNGAAGVWPGGGGGGGGGGCGGRTAGGLGFTGTGGAGGTGTNGAIRIVWPGNLRQFPSDNTTDWSMGEAGLWETVRSGAGILYSILHLQGQEWVSQNLHSTDNGNTWSSGFPTAYEYQKSPTKLAAQTSSKVQFRPLTGGAWTNGFSNSAFTGISLPRGLDTNGAGTWAAGNPALSDLQIGIAISLDDGVTLSSVKTFPGFAPGGVLYVGNDIWIARHQSSGTYIIRTTDNWQTLASVPTPSSSLNSQSGSNDMATNGKGTIIVLTSNSQIALRSLDWGKTWAHFAIPSTSRLLAIDCNPNTGVWVAVGTDGAMIRSVDDGITFETVPSGTPNSLLSISHNGAGVWMACGANGTIIRSTL